MRYIERQSHQSVSDSEEVGLREVGLDWDCHSLQWCSCQVRLGQDSTHTARMVKSSPYLLWTIPLTLIWSTDRELIEQTTFSPRSQLPLFLLHTTEVKVYTHAHVIFSDLAHAHSVLIREKRVCASFPDQVREKWQISPRRRNMKCVSVSTTYVCIYSYHSYL